jgi:hypothetical protein
MGKTNMRRLFHIRVAERNEPGAKETSDRLMRSAALCGCGRNHDVTDTTNQPNLLQWSMSMWWPVASTK